MKRISWSVVCICILLCFCLSCSRLNTNNIHIKVSESEHYYSLDAQYKKDETRSVDNYLDDHLGKGNDISFTNARIDADLTLNDGTKLYMDKAVGKLIIKFNKDENSMASYIKIKDLAEGLKPIMSK